MLTQSSTAHWRVLLPLPGEVITQPLSTLSAIVCVDMHIISTITTLLLSTPPTTRGVLQSQKVVPWSGLAVPCGLRW